MDLCIDVIYLHFCPTHKQLKEWAQMGSSGVADGVLRKKVDGPTGALVRPPHFSWSEKEEALWNRLQSPPRIVIRHKRPQKGNKPSAAAAAP